MKYVARYLDRLVPQVLSMCELLQVIWKAGQSLGMRLVSSVVDRCAHECQLKMQGLSTCSGYLAKRRRVFKVSHSLKVFSTQPRSGELAF